MSNDREVEEAKHVPRNARFTIISSIIAFIILLAGLLSAFLDVEQEEDITKPTGSTPNLAYCPSNGHPDGDGMYTSSKMNELSTLTVATYNAEWLFDGIDDPYRTYQSADSHISDVARVISRLNADVINIVELEDCSVLSRVSELISHQGTRNLWVPPTGDTATHQSIGLITTLPVTPPGIQRIDTRAEYPVAGSQCGVASHGNGGKMKTSGVTKHWWGVYYVNGFEILMIGLHLKARPNHPQSCAKREAQAQVISELVKLHGGNREILIMGDFNDFDGNILDISNNQPNSNVLKTLSTDLGLMSVHRYLPQTERFTWSGQHDPSSNMWPDSAMDFILISEGLQAYTEAVWVDRNDSFGSVSDHLPLAIRFRFSN